jgi:hypothetical protein
VTLFNSNPAKDVRHLLLASCNRSASYKKMRGGDKKFLHIFVSPVDYPATQSRVNRVAFFAL